MREELKTHWVQFSKFTDLFITMTPNYKTIFKKLLWMHQQSKRFLVYPYGSFQELNGNIGDPIGLYFTEC